MAGSRRHSMSGDPYHRNLYRDHVRDHDQDSGYGGSPVESTVSHRGRRRFVDDDERRSTFPLADDHYRDARRHSVMPRPHSHDRESRHHETRDRHWSLDRHSRDYARQSDRHRPSHIDDDEDNERARDFRRSASVRHPRDPRRIVVDDDYRDGRRNSEPVNDRYGHHDRHDRHDRRNRHERAASRGSRRPHDRSPPRDGDEEHRDRPRRPHNPHRRYSSAPAPPDRDRDRHRDHSPSSHHGGGTRGRSPHGREHRRSSRYPPNSSRSSAPQQRKRSGSLGGDLLGDVPWQQAARCAFEAGTMAALRVHDKPGAWIGTKGAQIATAAIGAAVVDGIITNKKPGLKGGKRHAMLKQVTTAAIGNLVLSPAGKHVEKNPPNLRHVKTHLPARPTRR